MSERFIKFIPSEESFWLIHKKPNAFRLLTHIANTARRRNGNPDGLLIGQCHLQHWKNYDFTEQEYRTAKDILVKRKHIIIIETNRTRQKSTTGSTTNSTLVQICSSTIFDINPESDNDLINDRATTEQRPSNDKQEGIRKKKNEEEKILIAQPAPQLRKKSDLLSFDFEKFEFVGITPHDATSWKEMYPHIDVAVEIAKASNWLKSNPGKSKKKLWRKFLTGWFQRSNDSAENKKAYRSAANTNPDRRTKDIHGNPVQSPVDGRF